MKMPASLKGMSTFHSEIEKSLKAAFDAIQCDIPYSVYLFGYSDGSPCYIHPSRQIPPPLLKSLEQSVRESVQDLQSKVPDPSEMQLYGPINAMMDAVGIAMQESLVGRGKRAFVSWPEERDGRFDMVVVLVDAKASSKQIALIEKSGFERRGFPPSLPISVIEVLLEACHEWLEAHERGKLIRLVEFDPLELNRRAAARFLGVAAHSGGLKSYIRLSLEGRFKLYDVLNDISFMSYERTEGRGGFIVANNDASFLDIEITLSVPFKVTDRRAVRKLLEVTGRDRHLISDAIHVLGIGRIRNDYDPARNDAFLVEFKGRGIWELSHNGTVLMRVENGLPRMAVEEVDQKGLQSILKTVAGASSEHARQISEMVLAVVSSRHGAIIVISSEGKMEAERLRDDCTPVSPRKATGEMLSALSRVDGAVLLDSTGQLHCFGLILDGIAASGASRSRGSRYNSALRYQKSEHKHGNAVVVTISEDGMVKVFPDNSINIRKPRNP